MKKRQDTIVFYVVMLIFGIALRVWIMPGFIRQKANVEIGPEMFPELIATILIALLLAGLILEMRALKAEGGGFAGYSIAFKAYLPHALFLLSGIMFLIAAPILGFLIAAIPFLLFLLFLFGSRKKVFNLVVSIVYPVVLVLIFVQILRISFPAGIFGI